VPDLQVFWGSFERISLAPSCTGYRKISYISGHYLLKPRRFAGCTKASLNQQYGADGDGNYNSEK
jgi:hypothetical protein